MFKIFTENNLTSDNQSGFKLSDSCINQILSITLEIYQSFDDDLDVRNIVLDISKVFDNVYHKGLIYKLNDKLFGDNTSLFSVVRDSNTLMIHFNNNFKKVSNWALILTLIRKSRRSFSPLNSKK